MEHSKFKHTIVEVPTYVSKLLQFISEHFTSLFVNVARNRIDLLLIIAIKL